MRESVARISVALEQGVHCAGQILPLLLIFLRRFFPFFSEQVVFSLAAVIAGAPFGLDEAFLLELMQGGVKSAFLECEGIGTAAGGLLHDLVCRLLLEKKKAEQNQADTPLQQLPIDLQGSLS